MVTINGKTFWETFGVQRILSPKHPGDIFFKIVGSKDDFVCKFYAGHEQNAKDFEEWANQKGLLSKQQQDSIKEG